MTKANSLTSAGGCDFIISLAFTHILVFPIFEYFLVSATTGPDGGIKSCRPVDRMKSDLRRASRMQDFLC